MKVTEKGPARLALQSRAASAPQPPADQRPSSSRRQREEVWAVSDMPKRGLASAGER
jgi:hypothetical protein